MQRLIENIARALVDSPDQVSAATAELDGTQVIELHVQPADLGKVIGRQGRTARSLRVILAAAANKQNRRYSLEIME